MIRTIYKCCRSIVPMVLLTLSVGWCYAWSLFTIPIVDHIGATRSAVQLTFCLNILLLGLGAAFFGNLVEKHIKLSSFLSTLLLVVGFLLSSYGIRIKNIIPIYLGSGICCGLSQGIAYVISPKNLLLWWSNARFKATIMSLSIICFGLGSSLCTILFNWLYPLLGLEKLMLALGLIYVTMMSIATLLINKPKYALLKIKKSLPFDYMALLKSNSFWRLWLFMFLNISAGLILIGNCAPILKNDAGLSVAIVTIVMFICGLSNGFGRLLFPVVNDLMSKKTLICLLILAIEICVVVPAFIVPIVIPFMIIVINACYGAGFAVLPNMILHTFGKDQLTVAHSAVLSAWGIASVFAYACTSCLKYFSLDTMPMVLASILVSYMLNVANSWFFYRRHSF